MGDLDLLNLAKLHPVLRSWINQLCEEDIAGLIERDGQIEVRLYANKGKVRKAPVIMLNSGPQILE